MGGSSPQQQQPQQMNSSGMPPPQTSYSSWLNNMFNPQARQQQQSGYSPNNFILPQVASSPQLGQNYAQDPSRTMAAFSPAAFQQMFQFYRNQGQQNPNGQPDYANPGQNNSILQNFNQSPYAAPDQSQQQQPAQAQPQTQPQGQPGGIYVPEWGSYIYPGQMQQYTGANQQMPQEAQNAIQSYLTNLGNTEGQQQIVNDKDPWSSLMYQYGIK